MTEKGFSKKTLSLVVYHSLNRFVSRPWESLRLLSIPGIPGDDSGYRGSGCTRTGMCIKVSQALGISGNSEDLLVNIKQQETLHTTQVHKYKPLRKKFQFAGLKTTMFPLTFIQLLIRNQYE